MEEVTIKAVKREVTGKQVKALRRQGLLPAVLYGRNFPPTPISLDLRDASHTLSHMTTSALVTVVLDGEKHLALVRERQRDFIRGTLKHIDFQVVSMKEKLRTSVSVVMVGESPAVTDFNGVLVTGLDEVEVECFPQDLPERIMADVSGLKQIGDAIYVRNLVISEKVEVLEDPNEVVVVVTAQAAEEVEEVVVEEVVAEPELIEKGKKEEEEEGEAEE
jgi:large subunit ribosomal protein L25